jgi:hypothetical protein
MLFDLQIDMSRGIVVYEIIGGANEYILWLEGDVTGDFPLIIDTIDIIESTGNNGTYLVGGYGYNVGLDRTEIWLNEFLPVAVYNGYVTNIVKGEGPG